MLERVACILHACADARPGLSATSKPWKATASTHTLSSKRKRRAELKGRGGEVREGGEANSIGAVKKEG